MGLSCHVFAQPPGKKLSRYEKNYYKWLKETAQQKSFDSIVSIAEKQFQAGSYKEALGYYNKALEIIPTNTQVIAKKNDLILLLRFLEESTVEKVPAPNDSVIESAPEITEIPIRKDDSIPQQISVKEDSVISTTEQSIAQTVIPKDSAVTQTTIATNEPEIVAPEVPEIQVDQPKVAVKQNSVEVKPQEPQVVVGPPKIEKELPVKDSVLVVETNQKIHVPESGKPVKNDSTRTVKPTVQHNSTKRQYAEGFTEEIEKVGNKTITYRVFVENGHADIYKKVVHSWGGIFYFKNDQSVGEVVWAETEELIKKFK